ncbi:conserved hypothetical protein [Candida dubliniensis CD36]|uniref:DUF1749-domain-containing protein n=1 Tax=Candida dubliniensis (strain CD36 / ATCC MYA-646 / CBS 7987 / NCPF 3949 / NRRL Y-17841) TaxID=573826 RepID=B9WDH9_CANDC|nr:conserved hypothetical protein [Candida dubliniensis CD36]CAX42735.1 conserved hypothetical protein [Candida dubliniensis CD36]
MSLKSVPQQKGIVHTYGFNLTAFEFTTSDSKKTSPNVILFVGGLGNGLLNVPYLPQLADSASNEFQSADGGSWSLVQVLLSSAYQGWGTSSLDRDAFELQSAIEYFRSERGGNRQKIVIMGHSTGCQDVIHYLTKTLYKENIPETSQVQGGILQAPVSDSEALSSGRDPAKYEALIQRVYEEYISKGRENEILPQEYRKITWGMPTSAYRFYSLASKRGDDDYFSSYLTEDDYKNSFGKVNKPLLVLYGSIDEFVPEYVDKEKLVSKWKQSTPSQYWSEHSQIIKGATHNLGDGSDAGVIDYLVSVVKKFISDL